MYFFFICVVIIVLCFILYCYYFVPPINKQELKNVDKITVLVENGMTTSEIASLLKKKGIINSEYLFRICAIVEKLGYPLKAGEYLFEKNMFALDIVYKLTCGEMLNINLTIPEGYTVDQIAKLIEKKGLGNAEKFKNLAKYYAPYDYIKVLPGQKYSVEGFLFPDTYRVSKVMDEEYLLKIMVNQFDKHLNNKLRDIIATKDRSIYDVIILASLIEKEAKIADEKTIISGVFINRIKKAMPLQSCATIQYLLNETKEELTIEDTKITSLYNTYKCQGLPLGPIANPGFESIIAAIFPATTDYFYFVADKQGKHFFSKTYDEHLALINIIR